MKGTLYFFALAALIGVAVAVRCKTCSDCSKGESEVDCGAGTCYKYKVSYSGSSVTAKGCVPAGVTCSKDLIQVPSSVKIDYNDCCNDEDYCNGATWRVPSTFSLLTSVVAVLICMWFQ